MIMETLSENVKQTKLSDDVAKRLSSYAIIGYGIDIVNNEPKEPLVEFTYEKQQTFSWQGQEVLIPDQILFDETPSRHWEQGSFKNKITTSREFQRDMCAKVGLSVTDPETNLTFGGDAKFTNELFSQSSSKWALELHINNYDVAFLQLKRIDLAKALLPDILEAIADCGIDENKINNFYDIFGTHVLKSAAIGGKMQVRTSVKLDVNADEEVRVNKVDIGGNIKTEGEDYIKGKLKFSERDKNTQATYRKISNVDVMLIGGDVTSPDESEWLSSLNNSTIPTRGTAFMNNFLKAPGFVANYKEATTQNLALVDTKYIEIYKVLALSKEQEQAFEACLKKYLKGINPFEDKVQRLEPEMNKSFPIERKGEKRRFKMKGWMASYETYAGLKAKPGAWVIVECKSDAERNNFV